MASTNKHEENGINRGKKLHLSLPSAQFLAVSLQAPVQSYEHFCKNNQSAIT